ncbi:multicopper oxidase domain-containing protein [Microbacterium esteraromaticum]|nr:multicopper oxidase domain-containing protein [Microbacterium esteraromaticum]
MRDIPTVVWLVLTVLSTIVHRWVPMPAWLMLHLLLLGAVTHAILVWSQYFSFALLRSSATADERRRQNLRLIFANGGTVIIVAGVLTAIWPITLAGVAALLVAVVWHGLSLYRRARTSMPGKFGRTIRYYITSAALLTIGALLGAWLARGDGAPNLVLAHALINVLGWIGVTVAGTVVTLWPTILRTRADEHAATGAARALPVLAGGVVVAATGAALEQLLLVAAGLAGYLAGLVIIGVSLVRAARRKPPHSFAALSVGAALVWWAGTVAFLAVGAVVFALPSTGAGTDIDAGASAASAASAGFAALDTLFAQVVPFLAAGFAAQVLLGALSYLIPVVLGGGPTPVRVGTAGFDSGGILRATVANAALAVCALPVSSLLRVVASMMYLLAMASFLVILPRAMRAQRRAKAAVAVPGAQRGTGSDLPRRGPIVPEGEQPRGRRAGQAVAGLLAVVLVSAGIAAADPAGMGWSAAPTGAADAPVQTVQVEAADMRFTPNRIEVPVGTRLVIEITNTDASQVHDLVFANGIAGGRLAPGESETIDVGVITGDLDGWCSILGHRQMGMTLQIVATGADSSADAGMHGDHGMPGAADAGADSADGSGVDPSGGAIDLMADPGEDFEPFDAVLRPLAASDGPVTREVTLTVTDEEREVAPGVTQTLWTYNGTAPGPVLHGRVGDTFVITLVNDASMGHSIDFHAGALAPNEPMRTIAPGERLTYTFTATRSGIWMYHCSTMPMSAHIANGMYGAVVIEPDDLPAVDRSYVLVQGEYYLGDHDGGMVDMDAIATRNPDLVTFNGYANQYDHAPLPATVGERVRVWVLDAGVERPSSFHVVGGQFDTVWSEGAYSIERVTGTGAQVLPLMVAQGGFVELTFPEAGDYPFVSHFMIDAERGAHGTFAVRE